MNHVYSPGSPGVPYANAKGIGYPSCFPMGYAAAAPAYSPNVYPGANPTPPKGYSLCPPTRPQEHPAIAMCPSVVITLQMFENGAMQSHR
uniref:Myelin-associated neurite-outgrowth inhibitor n=1 Tax=Prolemur simus TaxID=1328070 RepID=A0A8C8ZGX6_PROSS